MLKKLKLLGLAATVGVAALVPLFGDPRSTPVTHAEWARMLLRALEMEDVVKVSDQASQVFATLSWKNSLAYKADGYSSAEGVNLVDQGGARRLVAAEQTGAVSYRVAVVRPGDYKLRVRLAGSPSAPASAEIIRSGEKSPAGAFRVVPTLITGWVEAGSTHLDPGSYMAELQLPVGTTLDSIEVAPPCLSAIEPLGGWRAPAITQSSDIAVTMLKALDKESELPPKAAPIELSGSDFQTGSALGSSDGVWLKGGVKGFEATAYVNVPEDGLYTIWAFGSTGGGSRWLADSCRKAVVCGSTKSPKDDVLEWRSVMTTEFTAGRHAFTLTLGPGASLQRLRLERRKQAPEDYIATIQRLGFDPGPEGPVTRNKAVDAMNFLKAHRGETVEPGCGDVVAGVSAALQAEARGGPGGPGGLAEPAAPPGGPGAPGLNVGASAPSVGGPPAIPPQQPASPIQP